MKNKKGFILILTLIFMTVLTVFTGALLYMATADMRNVAPQSDDVNMGGMADAGINKAYRAISDDYAGSAPSPGSRTGVADLRGADTSLSSSIGAQDNMRYIDSVNATINNNNDLAILRTFDSNYTNTRIVSVVPYIRASRATGGSGATVQFSYTTDGINYTTLLTQVLPNSAVIVPYAGTAISGLTWSQIMSPNFRLRAIRTAGNRDVNVDSMYLQVTYGIDTLKELWATGGYATFPISLSGGTVDSITVTDEESKVHLNYASQLLLQNLLTNLGVSSAATKATNIVNFRGAPLTNPFDSVEELQQVTGITVADYTAIKNYVTAYSFLNPNSYNTHPATAASTSVRAPVNVNTAPFGVLKAIFDPLGLGAGDSTTLANAIITFRNSTPFTCFYTSNAAVTTDLFDFVRSQGGYLTAAEQNTVIDNADASYLAPVSGFINATETTEFCYASTVFNIDTLVSLGGRHFRVKTLRGNGYDTSRIRSFATYSGDAIFSGWRKENFE